MMYRLVLQKSVTVPCVSDCCHISPLSSDRFWISDNFNLILTNTAGDKLHHLTDIYSDIWGGHTVNCDGDLIYIDGEDTINKLSTDNRVKTTLIKYNTAPWRPVCVYSSHSTGDLLVGMCHRLGTGKLFRYTSTGEHIQTIQHYNNTGEGLYIWPVYITENRNGDVIVSDVWRGVVVTDGNGKHRFSYTGPPSGSGLLPQGICTDALSHILVCDGYTESVQMLDRDGKFLTQIQISPHGVDTPWGLSYDDRTHLLWVGSAINNTVNIYRVLYGDSLTGKRSGLEVVIKDLTGSSKDIVSIPSDSMLPPPRKICKRARTSFWPEMTFNKKLEQLKENGEFEFRIQRLIRSLNIEIYHQSYHGNHMETTGYEDIIKRVDYLDCSGLHFSKAEKQSKSFKPFSQSSVEDFLEWMADCNEVFRKTQSPICQLILSIVFSAYTKEALLEFKQRDLSFLIHQCLEYAIENQNHILVLELVRLYIFNFDFHLDELLKDKGINSVVMDTFLTTAKFMILRECPRLRQNAIRLSFCVECSQKNRLVIMMLYKDSIEMKDGIPEKVMGVELVLHNYTQLPDEASAVYNSSAASCLSQSMHVITEKDAKKLFKKHSNLTLISASPFKSTGYLKGRHRVVEKPCVSLLCLHKGYIPFGEGEFPKQVNGFDVDVQEGYCSLGSGRSIDFGGHIRRARKISGPECGSIGGFVDLPNDPKNPNGDTLGLITCSHVVFSSDELKIPRNELKNMLDKDSDFEVEVFDKYQQKFQICGNIVDKVFPELCSDSDNSVDAALIKLDPTVNEFGFPLTQADELYSAGFDPHTPPVFKGDVIKVTDPDPFLRISNKIPSILDSVVKYGSKTKFTIGSLYYNGVHIRFLDETLGLPDKINFATMYNQIEIKSLPHGTFFEAGDSGAFVFCINQDKTLSCLGMAIGTSTKGSCLVTPMVRILDSFGLPHRLKPCSPFGPRNTSSASGDPTTSNLEQQHNDASSGVDLGAILLNLQTSVTNMQTSMKSMQSSITGVQNQQTCIQTSLQSVKAEVGNLKTQVQAEVCNLKAQIHEIEDEFHTKSSTGSSDIKQN